MNPRPLNLRPLSPRLSCWTRRAWLGQHAAAFAVLSTRRGRAEPASTGSPVPRAARIAPQTERQDLGPLQLVAQQVLDAVRSAGTQYADVRFTRTVGHRYLYYDDNADFDADVEFLGAGVRVLVNGYWGFAACPSQTLDAAVQVARDAVAQAKVNAKGPPRTVDLHPVPVATGHWETPIRIDPFTIPIEDKLDYFRYLGACARTVGLRIPEPSTNHYGVFECHRQERLCATSEGTLVTQVIYESGGRLGITPLHRDGPLLFLEGLQAMGKGWEIFQDAELPTQLAHGLEALAQEAAVAAARKPVTVGKYTLVCDGTVMATLLGQTLGLATQLDRALGYEANASGTSFLEDPLAKVGTFPVAAPSVTITANRTAPTQLATVKWDDEGVEAPPFPLVKHGVLVDFQTTREQAAWLAPYYGTTGRPVHSHGCAASEDALGYPLQMMPNLTLEPGPAAVRLEDLVADVSSGILMTGGVNAPCQAFSDFQARSGTLWGQMREITNGRVGRRLTGGAVRFETLKLWKGITALGGPATEGPDCPVAEDGRIGNNGFMFGIRGFGGTGDKGEPPQTTSFSMRAVAALIPNQPIIDPTRKV